MSEHVGRIVIVVGIGLFWLGLTRGKRQPRLNGALASGRVRVVVRLVAPSVALAIVGALVSWWLARLPIISLLAAVAGGFVPYGVRRVRGEREARERERAWPAALMQLADGLEGGLAFPAAAQFVANSGPSVLRARFARFYQAIRDGQVARGLDELAVAPERAAGTAAALLRASFLETPTGRAAPMLRELAVVLRERWELREKARGRALSLHREAAILAVSPIAFLLLIGSFAPGYLNAYRTVGGTLVSVAAAVVIGGCYLAMRRLGRIPEPGGET